MSASAVESLEERLAVLAKGKGSSRGGGVVNGGDVEVGRGDAAVDAAFKINETAGKKRGGMR